MCYTRYFNVLHVLLYCVTCVTLLCYTCYITVLQALLERALTEVRSDQRRYQDDPRQMDRLTADQQILDGQLSDVVQQLADQSMVGPWSTQLFNKNKSNRKIT